MNQVINVIDSTIEKTGQWISYLSLGLVILIAVDVILRYVFNWSSSANQEMEWHLFATLFLLGSAFTLKHDKHVRVDVFYARFNPLQKAWINFIGTLVFLIPFCLVIFITSIPFASDAYSIGEASAEPGGLPHRFMIKSMIPASALLLFLQAISTGLTNFLMIFTKSAP